MATDDTTPEDKMDQNDTEGHRLTAETLDEEHESRMRTSQRASASTDESQGDDDVEGHKSQ
jgi:hypothetical protein